MVPKQRLALRLSLGISAAAVAVCMLLMSPLAEAGGGMGGATCLDDAGQTNSTGACATVGGCTRQCLSTGKWSDCNPSGC